MAQSIEELASIIKDYARKYRKFNERLGDVEVKLFGQARDDKRKGKPNKANGKENNINRSQLNTSQLNRSSNHSPPVKEVQKKKKIV